ncbi:hypothetical protein CBL_05967 [Carabus blaptoides fortunei]
MERKRRIVQFLQYIEKHRTRTKKGGNRRCAIEDKDEEESSLDIRFTVSLQLTNKPFPPDMSYRYWTNQLRTSLPQDGVKRDSALEKERSWTDGWMDERTLVASKDQVHVVTRRVQEQQQREGGIASGHRPLTESKSYCRLRIASHTTENLEYFNVINATPVENL